MDLLEGLPLSVALNIIKTREGVDELAKPYKDTTGQLRQARYEVTVKVGEDLTTQVIVQFFKPVAERRVVADFSPESYAALKPHIEKLGLSWENFFESCLKGALVNG